jgi:hypothetical protein
MPVTALITPSRSGDVVTATWFAIDRYQYIWAVCTAPGYETWVAVRSETWEDATLEWTGVPDNATVALMSPYMRGERRIWRTIAKTTI